jgi:hypothetical protein
MPTHEAGILLQSDKDCQLGWRKTDAVASVIVRAVAAFRDG